MSALHDDALDRLRSWQAPSARQERLRREYVDHLLAHPDGLARTLLPDHVTASTLVVTPGAGAVLLTLHAKAGRWFQLGGHLEPGDRSLAGGALREAVEESGVAELELDPVPVHLDAHEVPFCGGPGTRHLDVRFLAVAPEGAVPVVSEESSELRWWPAAALPSDEPSLVELVDLARRRLLRGDPV